MDTTKFYFGKLNFKQLTRLDDFEDPNRDVERPDQIQEQILKYAGESNIIYQETDGHWRFGRCEPWRGKVIGRLGKIFTEERTTWDEEEEDYVTSAEELEVADVSHFIVDPELEGIVFNRKLHTGSAKFAEAFSHGYNQFYGLTDGLDIRLLRTGGDRHYSDILRSARRIFSIDFDLVPTNPSADDEMAILDEHIHEMNAERMGLEAESKEGLNPEEDFIRSGFALSDDGNYGDYTIRFEEDGEEKSYDSRGDHATQEKEDPDELLDIQDLSTQLIKYLRDLLDQDDKGD